MKIAANTVAGEIALYHEDGNVVLRTEHDFVVLNPDQADRLAFLLNQMAEAAFNTPAQR